MWSLFFKSKTMRKAGLILVVFMGLILLAIRVDGYRGEIKQLTVDNALLQTEKGLEEESHKATQRTFSQYRRKVAVDLQLAREKYQELTNQYQEARDDKARVEEELSKHDLQYLAKIKPKAMRRIFLSGTNRLLRVLNEESRSFSSGEDNRVP